MSDILSWWEQYGCSQAFCPQAVFVEDWVLNFIWDLIELPWGAYVRAGELWAPEKLKSIQSVYIRLFWRLTNSFQAEQDKVYNGPRDILFNEN